MFHLHILSKPIDIHAHVWMHVQMYVYVHHYMWVCALNTKAFLLSMNNRKQGTTQNIKDILLNK